MNEYEKEFEESKNDLEKRLQISDQKVSKLEVKLEKVEGDKNEYKREVNHNENQVEKLQKELQKTLDKGMHNAKKVV